MAVKDFKAALGIACNGIANIAVFYIVTVAVTALQILEAALQILGAVLQTLQSIVYRW